VKGRNKTLTKSDQIIKELYRTQERQAWLRSLDFIQQETIHLKNNLAIIIKNDIDSALLENAEFFQNEFIKKDTVISLLRHDIAKQAKMPDIDDKIAEEKQEKLRHDMEKVEKELSRLKFEYNNCLAKTLIN
jgi:hypothetical protein